MHLLKIVFKLFLFISFYVSFSYSNWIIISPTSVKTDGNPNYSNDQDYTTTLNIPGATKLEVTIIGDIEYQTTCNYDYVNITKLTDISNVLNQYCGIGINQTFTVNDSGIGLVFHSDSSVVESGVTITITDISPNTPPTANAGADQTVSFGSNVLLSGTGTDSDGTIASYLWTEGATTLSNSASFSKSDFTVGIHTLTLAVTDNDGATSTDTVTITVVANFPPTANAGADQLINLGDSTSLDASGSSDSDGSIVSYLWQEGTTTLSTNVNFTLTTLTAGIHNITLTVTDDKGDTGTDTVEIKVNTVPVANAGPDQNITLGDSITLDGSGSTDDFNAITYAWTEVGIPVNETGVSPTINITTAGIYTITLTVTDDNGLTDTDTVAIRVNTPPVVQDMNFTILKNTPITFALTATDDDNDTIVSYPIFTPPAHGSLSGPESNLTYTPDANYTGVDTLTYKAFDGISHSNLGTVTFNIYPPATAVHDDFNTTYNTLLNGNVLSNDLGLNIHLIDFNSSVNGLLNIGSDGNFTYLPNVLFDGNDTFSYTIKDDFNITSTTTVTILVHPPRSDLSIIKTAPTDRDFGFPMDYTLTIQNNPGSQYISAKNVRVTDYLPSGVTYTGVTVPTGWTCGHQGGTVSCDASNLPLGYSGSIVIHTFAPQNLGDITNTATVSSDTIDSDLSNNSDSATTTINGPDVDLSITKTVSVPTATTTASFFYTLNVQNSGTADASGVTITDNLDLSLGFISIDSGTDWVCSQSSTVICSYIANGGIFVAGGSSNDIVINVRAPATEANITNTASVTSDIPEVTTSNNSASVDINITDDTTETPGVPLSKYLQYNLYGDMKLIGNANINKLPGDADQNYNDNINMHYVGEDPANGIYNSSSSTLVLDTNRTILWAGVYWEGHICSSNAAGDSIGSGTGCNWENSPYSNFNQASSSANLGSVLFKTPQRANSINLTANTLNIIKNGNDWTYSAFTDVTNILANDEAGEYTVSNVVLTEGQRGGGGNYGGWAMLVIYEDANKSDAYKNISVFNGFQYINSDGNELNITGFLTPRSGDINASIAFFAADGDPANGGVARMREKTTTTYTAIGSVSGGTAESPSSNLFNSTISEFGQAINSGITKTYGVDADRIDVSDFMENNQTDTRFLLDVSNPSGAGVDHYSISLFAFATDLSTPLIDYLEKSAYIIDQNGSRRVAGPNQLIYPGSALEYTITFTNRGDEVAEGVVIFDDFDFDGLSGALDVNHFDTTKLKLSHGIDMSNEITNPDCGYDIADRRVYCKLDEVLISESYTMQFVVTVKEDLNFNDYQDQNASNTAYAKYRNPNGNNYVEFYTTPITNEPVGGKSNTLNGGTFSPIDRGGQGYISIDAINAGYNYSTDKNITTKIVHKPFEIQLIHRDENLIYSTYEAWQNSKPMLVLVTLEGDGSPTPPLTTGVFNDGTYSTTVTGINLERAHRNDKLKMAYLDWNTILSWAPSTSACVINPAQSVNLNGVPACFNTYSYVEDIFPKASFRSIATCYGEGLTPTPAGRTYPCNPLAYATGGNLVNANIYPDAYNHDYGCYQCITEGFIHFRSDSTDEFAARPDYFEFNSTNISYPDLLRSGQEYNLSVVARDGLNNPTVDYNTTGNTFRMSNPTLNPSNDPAITASLEGNGSITASVATIRNGVSTNADGTLDINGNPVDSIGFTFNNVGEVGIHIIDPAWASVDADDTPEDCNTTQNAYGTPIEAGSGICGTITARFIPHHFLLTSSLRNHRDGTFTYMHTEDYVTPNIPHMAARVKLTLIAENAKNETTTNFKENAYENSISVDLNVTDWNATAVAAKPTPRLDINIRPKELSNLTLGFGTNGYTDGTYTIETNTSTPYTQQLMFNYDRQISTPKNPFIINGSEVNSSVTSVYTGSAPEGSATIRGTTTADSNATFYYGRIRPAESFYAKVTANAKRTPMLIDVYCNTLSPGFSSAQCNTLGIDTILGEFGTSQRKWWLALNHDKTQNDGNITLSVTGTGVVTPTVVTIIPANNAEDGNITVTPGTATRPTMVTVDLDTSSPNKTDTNEWLIYNEGSLLTPSPFFEVEFIGTANWTGHGNTGNVVGSTANQKKNKRLGW